LLKIGKLHLAAILAILSLAACTNGDFTPEPDEAVCEDKIEDETFDGPYAAIVGLGEGAFTALRLAMDAPRRFNVVVALDGPTSVVSVLADLEQHLLDFDDWAEPPSRARRIQAFRDWLAAYGNPFYLNDQSFFYPPGVNATDFVLGQPITLPPLFSPNNPNGLYPTVTVYDESGEPVDFALAHDLDGNGRRDPGEPLILWLHEPFIDANGDGIRNSDETYSDYGLDGVDGTGDFGEGDGQYTINPRLYHWLENDPATAALEASLDLDPGYPFSVYLDAQREGPWGYAAQMTAFADILESRLAEATAGEDAFCIRNSLGRYDELQSDTPVIDSPVWFPEKYVYAGIPGDVVDLWDEDAEAQRVARFYQALRFISLRMPNGLTDTDKDDEFPATWQIREFFSEALGEEIQFGVGFPAGYFRDESRWETYPVVYFFHDRFSTLNDWVEVLAYQGDLARRSFAKQALLIVVDGSRAVDDRPGYQHYVAQRAGEFGGDFAGMVEELIAYVEQTFRVQYDLHPDRD
jgi:hypothetical protein